MAGVYRPRHPEQTVLYRVLFHYFDRFLAEYENRFENEYGFFRPTIKEVVELMTEGGVDDAGVFHNLPRFDDSRLARLFAHEVLTTLVHRELLSPEWAERLLSWRHTGFNVHSRVRAKTRKEAERVGKYMIRPLLSLERLSLDERAARVCYRYGKEPREVEAMDYLEFIARVTSHIPDKGQVTVRYYGLYANAHRGKIKACHEAVPLRMVEEELKPIPAKGWAKMIRKVCEVDPMVCPQCGGLMKVIAFLTDYAVVDRIIGHLKLTFVAERPPSTAPRLSGIIDRRRGLPRVLFVILPLTARRGLSDFQPFSACLRLAGPFLLSQTQFDNRQPRDSSSLRMSGGGNFTKRLARPAEPKTRFLQRSNGSSTVLHQALNVPSVKSYSLKYIPLLSPWAIIANLPQGLGMLRNLRNRSSALLTQMIL
jgi:hypothetical protein